MAGTVKLLQYQMLAYWRQAFSIRGKYDSSSGFLLLIIAGFAYKYVMILNSAAKSVSGGSTENLNLILIIVFLSWLLPVLESQSISVKTAKFLHLPISKTQFALINLAAVFLLPTSIISMVISLAVLYPLAFSKHVLISAVTYFVFVLFSIFASVLFTNLLKIKMFRVAAFLSTIAVAVFLSNNNFRSLLESKIFLTQLIGRNIIAESSFANIGLLALYSLVGFFLALFSIRQTNFDSGQTSRKLNPQFLSRLKIPAKFGELVKKDFLYSWKSLDCWLSLLATIFYAILLTAGEFSFESFSVAISISVLTSGSLAFNIFGLENSSGIERLSLFPIKPENLIAAKNKTFALVIFSQSFFLFPLILFKFGALLLIVSILKTISIILFYTAWGNSLSIKFPFKMHFYQISFGGSLPAMIYGALVISLLVIVPEFLTAGNITAKLIAGISLTGLSFMVYRYFLQRSAQRLPGNWESIAIKLQ